MKKTVMIVGHPQLQTRSLTNKIIVNELKAIQTSEIEFRTIAELYPSLKIDVEKEQQALLKADTIVLQFPFHWYSVPWILKLWIDEVLSYGFAYGSTGDKLKGKNLVLSFTVGGPESSYTKEGYNSFTILEMLTPLIQTVNLCGMKLISPVYTHSMIYIPNVYNVKEEVEARAHDHATRLIQCLEAL